MIYSVAYRSVPAMPREGREAEVLAILKAARTKNATHGITGGLLIADGHFIQVIEGDRGAVDQLMGMIARDPRHAEFEIFYHGDRDERYFGDWAMAWIDGGMADVMALPRDDPDAVPAWLSLLAERAG